MRTTYMHPVSTHNLSETIVTGTQGRPAICFVYEVRQFGWGTGLQLLYKLEQHMYIRRTWCPPLGRLLFAGKYVN